MRILLLGAYGFIGSAIARELVSRGHHVTGLGRDTSYGRRILPQLEWITADLSRMTRGEQWRPLLNGNDLVVNASGMLQSGEGGSVEAVQLHSIGALVEACEAGGVRRLVQISAAGADPEARSDFMATKAQADALVEASAIPSLIVRPGLVVGRNSYGGTDLIRFAAAVPLILRFPFHRPIQCIALADVVDAVAGALDPDKGQTGCFDLVERQGHSLDAIVGAYRQWLGLPEPRWSLRIPKWLIRLASRTADLLGHLGWRLPLRRNALMALEAGVEGDADQSAELLGREPLTLGAALELQPAGKQDRLYARLGLVQPLMLAALIVMWAGSGAATLLQLDKATAIMSESGIGEASARAIAIGGGWIDVLLAAGLLWRPTVRPALAAMIVLTIFVYLIGGTMLVPQLWIDPLAPFAKALPATLLALLAYWTLERR